MSWPLSKSNPNLGAQIVEDAKEYVLYSWSTQDAINPIAVAGAEGRYFWDYDGKRYLDFASQLVNVNIGHQHPKIIAAIKEQADRLCTIGPPMASESRSRLGPAARGGHARRSLHVLLHELGRGGERERDQARAARDRAPQDHRALPLLPRGDARLGGPDRRSTPLAERAGDGRRRADARSVHVSLPGRTSRSVPGLHGRAASRGDPPVRGREHCRRRHPRDGYRDERDHPAPTRLLAGDPRGLRPARHPAHPRRGHGRLRPHRALVRMRELGRRPGHHHRGEGDQFGLRPARRDDHPRAPQGMGAEPVLPRRTDVRGASARLRVRSCIDRGLPGGRRRRERGRCGRVPGRRTARARCASSVDRRGARARLLLGNRAREEPGDARDARAVQRLGRGSGSGCARSRRRRSTAASI